jgi:hypothetical protein
MMQNKFLNFISKMMATQEQIFPVIMLELNVVPEINGS